MGAIDEEKISGSKPGLISVQCFPLFSVLLALNRTTVDYFSLDVEGSELDVLKTVPWELVNIKVNILPIFPFLKYYPVSSPFVTNFVYF